MKRIARVTSEPGGYAVEVEVQSAYTDGKSRVDTVHLPFTSVPMGATPAELLAAVAVAHEGDTAPVGALAAVTGQSFDTAARWEPLTRAFDTWQRWKLTRLEAVDRGVSAPIISALTNQENVAWTAYVAAIQAWRTAP